MNAACAILSILLGLALAGCGLEQVAARQRAAELKKQYQTALVDCKAKFAPEDRTNVVAAMQCTNNALAIMLPALGSNADLEQAFMAYRMSVAERIQNGEITDAQGAALITQRWSQVVSEAQRRNAVAQSAAAQQQAADAQRQAAEAAEFEATMQVLGQAAASANAAYANAPSPNIDLGTHCRTQFLGNMAYTNCY